MTFGFHAENIKENFSAVPLTVAVHLDAKCSARSAHTNTQNVFHCPSKLNALYYNTRSTFASICFNALRLKYRFYYCLPSIVEHWILRMLPYYFPTVGERKAQTRTITLSLSLSLSAPVPTRLCAGWYCACNWLYPFCAPSHQLMLVLSLSKPQLAIGLSHVVGTSSWNFTC